MRTWDTGTLIAIFMPAHISTLKKDHIKSKKYALRRIVMAFVTRFVVACVTFLLMNAIPGNPWLSEKTPSQATIDALNAKYGLDKPLIVQLGKYLSNLLHGDLRTSI